ncbi:MAG TPA: M28 family peptidase [Gemmatimonadales bacterium]|nr:M28 family peptidase [Gemmatimonadales bacterium]
MHALRYLILLVPSLLSAQAETRSAAAVTTISSQDIMERIAAVAHDSMLGRNNPSPGLEQTARYVASEFRRLGLRPAGEQGGYFQRFELSRWTVDSMRSSVTLERPGSRQVLKVGAEVRYVDGAIPPAALRGPVVLMAGSLEPGNDVRDRIALVVVDYTKTLPPSLGPDIYRLAGSGVRAVLLLSNRDSVTFAERLRTAAQPRLQREAARDQDSIAPILEVHERSLGALLAGLELQPARLRRSSGPTRITLPQLNAVIRLSRNTQSRANLPNVIGILEGSDSTLRHEFVAYSAHIDHIGLSPGQRDSINNGADDNASGVAGLLELAEAFSQPGARPRRSLLFLAPSAEEPGLLGSAHFTDHPTVPLQSIVADINMDLIGRNWPDSVIAVGLEQSDLGATLAEVVRAHPELRMTPIPDRWPEEQIFYRSDHYNFARKGVPILFFTSGTHSDYHRPSDEPSRINPEKESRLVQLLFYLGESVANRSQRPRWSAESYRQIVERKK